MVSETHKGVGGFFYKLNNNMAVKGTWGPQTGVLGFLNPFSRDYGYTELKNVTTGGNTTNPTWNNPAVYKATGGIPTNQNTTAFGSLPVPNYNPPGTIPRRTIQQTGDGGVVGGQPPPGNNAFLVSSDQGSGLQQQENQVRSDINTGYDDYFRSLDSIASGLLPGQRDAQLGIVQSQGTQAETTLGGQQTQSLADLASSSQKIDTNQVKTLQDLSENIRNMFKAGQISLGARGAGDSSAANQYSYAIAKEGNKARGNVFQQTAELKKNIDDKVFQVKNTYNTEIKNIKEQVNQKVMGVATWFSEQQQRLSEMKASGQLQRGADLANLSKQILGQATNAMLQAQQEGSSRRGMLDQWAMNNSKTVGELQGKLQAFSTGNPTGINDPNFGGKTTYDNQGNMNTSFNPGFGFSATGNKDDTTKQYPWLNNTEGVTYGA